MWKTNTNTLSFKYQARVNNLNLCFTSIVSMLTHVLHIKALWGCQKVIWQTNMGINISTTYVSSHVKRN